MKTQLLCLVILITSPSLFSDPLRGDPAPLPSPVPLPTPAPPLTPASAALYMNRLLVKIMRHETDSIDFNRSQLRAYSIQNPSNQSKRDGLNRQIRQSQNEIDLLHLVVQKASARAEQLGRPVTNQDLLDILSEDIQKNEITIEQDRGFIQLYMHTSARKNSNDKHLQSLIASRNNAEQKNQAAKNLRGFLLNTQGQPEAQTLTAAPEGNAISE